jgi:hypothetical protein
MFNDILKTKQEIPEYIKDGIQEIMSSFVFEKLDYTTKKSAEKEITDFLVKNKHDIGDFFIRSSINLNTKSIVININFKDLGIKTETYIRNV